jgi:hypothetical protein
MTALHIEATIHDYIDELLAAEVPLDAPLSVAAVLCDLCRLLDLPVPVAVEDALDAPVWTAT